MCCRTSQCPCDHWSQPHWTHSEGGRIGQPDLCFCGWVSAPRAGLVPGRPKGGLSPRGLPLCRAHKRSTNLLTQNRFHSQPGRQRSAIQVNNDGWCYYCYSLFFAFCIKGQGLLHICKYDEVSFLLVISHFAFAILIVSYLTTNISLC